ncbi:MAG: hypothetical protein ACK53Y_12905, partial [bacterium]
MMLLESMIARAPAADRQASIAELLLQKRIQLLVKLLHRFVEYFSVDQFSTLVTDDGYENCEDHRANFPNVIKATGFLSRCHQAQE